MSHAANDEDAARGAVLVRPVIERARLADEGDRSLGLCQFVPVARPRRSKSRDL